MLNELHGALTLPTILGELSAATQQAIQAELETVHLTPGQILFHQGDPGDSLYVLVAGRLAIQMQNLTGETVVVDEATPNQVIGEMALLTGQQRGATVKALTAATLFRLSQSGFDRLERHHPDLVAQLAQTMLPRLRQQQLLQILTRLFGALDKEALADLQQQLEWQHLVAGELLIAQGAASDAAYIVVNGRLRVTMRQADGREHFIREVGRGELIGEIGLLTQSPRSATVIASRATTVVRLSAASCRAVIAKHPQVMVEVARLMAGRQLGVPEPKQQMPATLTFALVAADPAVPLAALAERLAQQLDQWGATLCLDSVRFDDAFGKTGAAQTRPEDPLHLAVSGWLSRQEARYRFLILLADRSWTPWSERCTQLADRILLVKAAQADAALDAVEAQLAQCRTLISQELVLLHPPATTQPHATARWFTGRQLATHHHLRWNKAADWQRLARRLTGRAIALVLGGGGARGNAHVGAIRALLEAQIPIDLIGGTSFGAVIGALYAYTLDYDHMWQFVQRHSSRQQILDYTLPVTSFLAGAKSLQGFRQIFGEMAIEDLWLPCFAVSCDLSHATLQVHQQGPLALLLRATTAIPGVFAPVAYEGKLLVDGVVVNNFPADVMRELYQPGTVIGVNLSPPREAMQGYEFAPSLSGWPLLWQRLNPLARRQGKRAQPPSLISVLIRSLDIQCLQSLRTIEPLVDLLIEPEVEQIRFDAFDAYQTAHDRGYEATTKALAAAPPTWRAAWLPP